MNPFAAYGAINTKLHAKRKMFLSDKEWKKASEFQNANQVIDFMKKREGYQRLTAGYKTEDLHRADLEVILERYQVEQIEALLHYYSGAYKDFFKTFLMEYDIFDLQLILRSISRNEDMNNIEQLFSHSKKYGLKIYDKLTSCRNITQFIDALKGTVYYDSLKTMTQDDFSVREFHAEMKLYLLFYKTLAKRADKLSKKDRLIAYEMIGTKADFINIQWIYRVTKYYDISKEEILIYCIPYGNKLTYRKLKKLVYAKNLSEFKELAHRYLNYDLFKDEKEQFIDRTIDRYFYEYALGKSQDYETVAASIAYILLLIIEVDDIIALTESIRYALPQPEISKYLVHTI